MERVCRGGVNVGWVSVCGAGWACGTVQKVLVRRLFSIIWREMKIFDFSCQ